MEETFVRDFAIGEGNLTPTILINHLLANLKRPFIDVVSKEPARNLNHYIEAQIHGEISLKEDVEALVADPSFKGTDVGKVLEEICLKYAIDLYWHIGFVLAVDEVPMDFRGSKNAIFSKTHCTESLYRCKYNWLCCSGFETQSVILE